MTGLYKKNEYYENITFLKKYLWRLSLNKHLHCSHCFHIQQHTVCITQFAGFLSTVILRTRTVHYHMFDESLLLETLHCGARKMESQRNCKISIQFVRSLPNTHSFSTIFVPPPSHPPNFPAFARRYVRVCNSTRRCQLSKNSTMSTCLLMLKIRFLSCLLSGFFTLYRMNTQTYWLPHLHTMLLGTRASASKTSYYTNLMLRQFYIYSKRHCFFMFSKHIYHI